jgi:hypothetical protein
MNADSSADGTIWRYVDTVRLLALLEHRALYFCCIAELGDPFEGSLPRQDHATHLDAVFEDGADSGVPTGLFLEQANQLAADPRRSTFVSCWHLSDHESVAMWRLYSEMGKGVAIVSSVARLRHCLPRISQVSAVRYLDFSTDSAHFRSATPSAAELALVKRKEFAYEQELRAFFRDARLVGKHGRNVHVDPEQLISRLVIAPGTASWLQSLLQKVLRRYGYSFQLETSSLDVAPLYPQMWF